MAKLKVKGSALQIASGTTYTAVAQVSGFSVSGIESETTETDTLDAAVGIPYTPTGRVEGGSVSFDLLYDPALSGHQTVTDLAVAAHLLTTGLANDQNWKLVFANTSSTEMAFVSAGIGVEITGELADCLRSTVTLKCNGCPALPS